MGQTICGRLTDKLELFPARSALCSRVRDEADARQSSFTRSFQQSQRQATATMALNKAEVKFGLEWRPIVLMAIILNTCCRAEVAAKKPDESASGFIRRHCVRGGRWQLGNKLEHNQVESKKSRPS